MPHLRKRFIDQHILKKLTFFPILAIQGARQTGKSVLARELIAKQLRKAREFSFDLTEVKSLAAQKPQSFLDENEDAHPLIIDEAQKVPEIFDAIKYKVDRKRKPGQFVLLGSTEFSILGNIRESLTGRMGKIRLFPMVYREAHELPMNNKPLQSGKRSEFIRFTERGGMPGIFSIRGDENRTEQFEAWIDLTCNRDLYQFKKLKLDGELAREILKSTAVLNEPTQAEIAKILKVDGRKILSHLNALSALFAVIPLRAHPSGTGKTMYLPFDAGIAHHLGASLVRRIQICLMNERMLKSELSEIKKSQFFYYRSIGKKQIHWVEVNDSGKISAFQIIDHEKIKQTDAELMRAFMRKNKQSTGVVLGPLTREHTINGVTFQSWESML